MGWDTKGNLTTDPTTSKTYGYSSENLLTSGAGGVTLAYDPAMRLYQVAGAATTRFSYDGADVIAEYNGSSQLQRRFVYDDAGQPVVQYEGTGTASPRYLSADERGSVISVTDGSGTVLGINTYDEYGKPGAANTGRFQYTGQKWLSEIGAYDYKARVYLPHLGTFAQTDPLRQAAGPNLYAYVEDDPVNLVDPFGLDDTGVLVEHPGCSGGSFRGGVCITNSNPSNPSTPGTTDGGSDRDIEVVHPGCRGGQFVGGVCMPGTPHKFVIRLATFCPASEAFNSFKVKGGSAPGSPAITREGWAHHVPLYGFNGPNFISQFVNSRAMTIINVTERQHVFYPGTVTIRVIPRPYGSDIDITGQGTGQHPWRNDITGYGWFGGEAYLIQQGCAGPYAAYGGIG